MNSVEAKSLCESLVNADTEQEVIERLTAAGYWDDPNCWRYYGDKDLNWSQAGGQQGRADFALNEKAINSIDSFLTLKCLLAGIDPEGPQAPGSIRAAVARFIEEGSAELKTTGGRVEDWPAPFSRKIAENISIYATEPSGGRRGTRPCVNIADLGEGHTPEAFPNTFVSLGRRNKVCIQFVQGKFCQGGSGAMRHCGENKLQLIVSRRHPALLKSPVVPKDYPRHESDDWWGFTVVRREQASTTSKVPVLTYLAPLGAKEGPRLGGVLRFVAADMPLFPKGDTAYGRRVEHGTLIKLYEYQLRNTGNIIRSDGLLSKLDLLLPDPALPIRMHECRPRARGEGAREATTTMSGLFSRLRDNENVEDVRPSTMMISVRGRQVTARVFAFKPGKAKTYRENEGVIFTVNGQTHAEIKANIFARQRVGLQRLAKDLLLLVDCSALDANERDDLFMSSRDRVAEESPLFSELEKSLEIALRDHPGLRELKNTRAQQEIAEQLKDDKPLEAVLKQVLKNSPTLARLFGRGERLPTPFKPDFVKPEPVPELHQHPTFFHFSGKEEGEDRSRVAHIDQRCRVTLVTDAEDFYFTRKYDPGLFVFNRLIDGKKKPVASFIGPNLAQGRCNLSFELPEGVKIDDSLSYEVIVEDPVLQRVFRNALELKVFPAQAKALSKPGTRAKPPGQPPGPNRDGQGGISFPQVNWLKKSSPTWGSHFDDEDDCLDIVGENEEGNGRNPVYTFYLNEDNKGLQTELKASRGAVVALLRKKFEIATVLVGLALIHEQQTRKKSESNETEDGKDVDAELSDRVRRLTRALAPVLLPMIDGLNGLEADALEQSDLVGQAV